MKVMGFNFTKVSGEIFSVGKNIKVDTEMDIRDVKEVDNAFLSTKEKLLEAKFSYRVNYEPNVAKIIIEGTVLLALSEKGSEDVLKEWKTKVLPEDFKLSLVNTVMRRCTLKALNLCEELNLPIHIPLPSLKGSDTDPKNKK